MSVEWISQSLSIRAGQLFVEELDVASLARKFGTPLFVVSENHLRENLRYYRQVFSSCWREGQVQILPSIKANPLIAVRQVLTSEGAGCDVFGPGELEAAIRGGVDPKLISVNGSIKDCSIIRRAIEVGARIVLDSPRELQLCEEEAASLSTAASVMFRLKPLLDDIEAPSDYVPERSIRELTQIVKYGIPKSELMDMVDIYTHCKHVEAVGVHGHMGRHSKNLDVWESWIRNMVKLTAELSKRIGGWRPQHINIGGGFPSFPDNDTDVSIKGYDGPTLEQLANAITSTLRNSMQDHGLDPQGLILEIEPGRGIHCDTGIHLTTVRNLKSESNGRDHRWIETDTSQMFLGVSGVNFDSPKFEFLITNKPDAEVVGKADIVGKTCNLEILFYQVDVPDVEVGDIIALLNTGSYIEPCAQNFNALPRPGTVLVCGDQADLIKRHETVDDVFARDIVPERLVNLPIRRVAP